MYNVPSFLSVHAAFGPQLPEAATSDAAALGEVDFASISDELTAPELLDVLLDELTALLDAASLDELVELLSGILAEADSSLETLSLSGVLAAAGSSAAMLLATPEMLSAMVSSLDAGSSCSMNIPAKRKLYTTMSKTIPIPAAPTISAQPYLSLCTDFFLTGGTASSSFRSFLSA